MWDFAVAFSSMWDFAVALSSMWDFWVAFFVRDALWDIDVILWGKVLSGVALTEMRLEEGGGTFDRMPRPSTSPCRTGRAVMTAAGMAAELAQQSMDMMP